jgi:hypothetical protein
MGIKTLVSISIILLSASIQLGAQQAFKEISLYTHYGNVIPTNSFLSGHNQLGKPINSYFAGSIHVGFESLKNDYWNKTYPNATYGIGAQWTSFYPHKDLGNPISVYGYMQSDILSFKKFALRFNGELGLAWNWNKRSKTNALNDVISLERTVHLDAGLEFNYRLFTHHQLGVAMSFGHFSNGGTKRPNQGINTITPKLFYKYQFNTRPKNSPIEKLNYKKHIFNFNLVAGYHNYNTSTINDSLKQPFKGVNVRVFGINGNYGYAISPVLKVGIGADVMWDEGISLAMDIVDSTLINTNEASTQNLQSSVLPFVELRFHRISLSIQQGLYLYRQANNLGLPNTFQRIGLIFHFNHRWNAGAYLRAYNFKSANFIEASAGIYF